MSEILTEIKSKNVFSGHFRHFLLLQKWIFLILKRTILSFFSSFIVYLVKSDKFNVYLQSYGEESLEKEKKAIEEAHIAEEIAKKVNNEKPTAITMEAINKAANAAMRANKAQKRLEKIKIQRTIFPAITTLLSSYTKKKSFGMDSFFCTRRKIVFQDK